MDKSGDWQSYWSPKEHGSPDGCLALIKRGIEVTDFSTHSYNDDSGHIMQTFRVGQVVFANTHIKWTPTHALKHIGVDQTSELLEQLDSEHSAVILADCNDRPNGPVRRLIENAGFINVSGDEPTAIVNQELVALDLLALRGVTTTRITRNYNLADMPNNECPSDHIPLLAEIDIK